MKNHDTRQKKKKKVSSHGQSPCDEASNSIDNFVRLFFFMGKT